MKKEYQLITLFLALTGIIRVCYIFLPMDFSMREGLNGLSAWRITEGEVMYRDFYHSQTPLFAHMVAIVYALLGVGLTQGRLLNVIWSGLTFLVIYFNGKKVNMKTGLLGGLIFALVPAAIQNSVMIQPDFPAITFCLIGYYFFIESHNGNSKDHKLQNRGSNADYTRNLLISGLFIGLGILTKLTVAPMLPAFIAILIIEGLIANTELKILIKRLVILLLGVLISLGIVLPFFLLETQTRANFFYMALGQHVAKSSRRWLARVTYPIITAIQKDLLFFTIFFLLSLPHALKTRYGRGIVICIGFMVTSVMLMVPWPNPNYYEINIPMMAMICGMFPLSTSILKDFKSSLKQINIHKREFIKWIGVSSLIIYLVISPLFFATPVSGEIKLKNLILPLEIKSPVSAMDEAPKLAVEWLQDNTAPDEYVLSDHCVINIMAVRRGPFAEVSVDRTRVGQLDSDMLIQAVLQYKIRVIVVSGRAFGKFDFYDPFMDFVEENFTPIMAGYIIYTREVPLPEIVHFDI